MSTAHECPGGCGEQVPQARLACRTDWFRLPKAIRAAVWEAYREGQFAAHRAALADAADWYRDNPRAV